MANWLVVSEAGPSKSGSGGSPDSPTQPTNPNNLAATFGAYSTDGKTFTVKLTFDALTGLTAGLHFFDEFPANDSALVADGTMVADGTHPAVGDWSPRDDGKCTKSPKILTFPTSADQTSALSMRIYGAPYTANNVEAKLVKYGLAGATPSVLVTIPVPPGVTPTGPRGQEYCPDVKDAAVRTEIRFESGVATQYYYVTFTKPIDPRWHGCYIEIWPKGGASIWNCGVVTRSSDTIPSNWGKIPAWAANGYAMEVRFRSFADPNDSATVTDDKINTYIPGYTPMVMSTLGQAGTSGIDPSAIPLNSTDFQIASGALAIKNVDLGKALGSSFASAEFKIVGGQMQVNGVDLSKAISTTLSTELAVAYGQFGIAQVSAAKVTTGTLQAGVVYAGSITAGQIVSGTIASNIIYAGTINAGQVNAGAFTGCTLTLNANGITTRVTNAWDSDYGDYVGISITDGTYKVLIGANIIRFYQGSTYLAQFGATYSDIKQLVVDSAWNLYGFGMGSYKLWVDGSGRLRIKNGIPVSDTDGTIVGTQS